MKKRTIIQWAVYIIIGTWGFLSFCVLAGDENPNEPLNNEKFFTVKAIAAASLYACYRVGKFCVKLGLFPNIKMSEDEMED